MDACRLGPLDKGTLPLMSVITSRKRIVPPTEPVVSLALMQQHLNLDLNGSPPSHPDDDLIMSYVEAATNDMEGEDGWIGRSLAPQRWRIGYRAFPSVCDKNPDAALFLPYPPIVSVDSVRYSDGAGTLSTLTEGVDFEVNLDGDPHAWICPLYGKSWPTTADRNVSVVVEFTAGFDASALPANPIPAAIRQYVMLHAALMYQHREIELTNAQLQPIDNFLSAAKRFRVYGP